MQDKNIIPFRLREPSLRRSIVGSDDAQNVVSISDFRTEKARESILQNLKEMGLLRLKKKVEPNIDI